MKYQYWLARLDGIGNVTKRKLLKYFQSAKTIYETDKAGYQKSGHMREGIAEYVEKQKELWELSDEYEAFLEQGISFTTMERSDYPRQLLEVYNAPYALYYKGKLPAQEESVSIVGARRCSAYGRVYAEELAFALAREGISVASGMALGVDAAAHNGSIRGQGTTYAFLGCGVDVVYPRSHRKLYQQIIEHGAVISEYAPGTPPLAEHFPTRNRLIAGISEKTVVIEARRRSGSLITADLAMEQGKDVFALPGRVSDPMSEGTNHLIAQGAGIIESVEEFVACIKDLSNYHRIPDDENALKNLNLEKEELMVYSCLDFYAKGLEEVMQDTGLELLTALSAAMRLMELGLIQENFKNQYIRLR